MAKGRSLTIEIPKLLLDQIRQRLQVSSRSQNQEINYLVDYALKCVGEADICVQVPTRKEVGWVRTMCRPESEMFHFLTERAAVMHRSVNIEIVRLVYFAIEEMTRRDLAIIEAMITRRDREAPTAPQTAPT